MAVRAGHSLNHKSQQIQGLTTPSRFPTLQRYRKSQRIRRMVL
ncbi:MAG: hypothetical protein ACK526_20895 [Planctomyces sp.]